MPAYRQSFASEAIASGEYDTETEQLVLNFTSGRSYTYENVPEHVWDGLITARSQGSYFNTQIKNRY